MKLSAEVGDRALKITRGIKWGITDSAVRILLGVGSTVILARSFGPEAFGLISIVGSSAVLFAPFSSLALNSILVRHFSTESEASKGDFLGSGFLLRLVGGVVAGILMSISVFFVTQANEPAIIMAVIVSFSFVFRATDVFRDRLESDFHARGISIIQTVSFVISTTLKVLVAITSNSLVLFAFAILAEAIIYSIAISAFYRRTYKDFLFYINWKKVRSLIIACWPLALSSVAISAYMRLDQLMLQYFSDSHAVGIYSAATRISEVWNFIPMILVVGYFPLLVKMHDSDPGVYERVTGQLIRALTFYAAVVAIIISLASEYLIDLVYGHRYFDAALVLSIHVWSLPFVCLGIATSRWFILAGLQKYELYRTIAGLAVNLFLNFLLIPKFGAVGSAWSTLFSQMTASVLFNGLLPAAYPVLRLQISSLICRQSFDLLCHVKVLYGKLS